MNWLKAVCLCMVVSMVGCSSLSSTQQRWVCPPTAIPLQPTVQQEVQIARLTQLLQRNDLAADVRAKMFYERGSAYDSVGLRDLARLDYQQSLTINPAQPDIFNLLGVYMTQVGDFDEAYEAFDSTLELDPSNTYAERNQAVALYYGERPQLALEEMQKHYAKNSQDPFSALWLYIIQHKIDPVKAKQDLTKRYANKDKQWGWMLVAIMLNDVSNQDAFSTILQQTPNNTVLAQRLTETYFYLGKRYQMEGDYASAINLFKLSISFNVYEYVEHRYAFLELRNMFEEIKAKHLSDQKALQAQESSSNDS